MYDLPTEAVHYPSPWYQTAVIEAVPVWGRDTSVVLLCPRVLRKFEDVANTAR